MPTLSTLQRPPPPTEVEVRTVEPEPVAQTQSPPPPKLAPLTAGALADARRGLLRLLDKLEAAGTRKSEESVAARIGRLSRAGTIPRPGAACMRTVTEMRNAAEYDARDLSTSETLAVMGAWLAIREWAIIQALNLPSLTATE